MNIKINDLGIGDKYPTFIIAEISANHNQDLTSAVKHIKKAKQCGADAVKFQAYTPDSMTIDVDNKYFQVKHPMWGGQTLYELYKKASTPWKWFKKLKKVADEQDIVFFATAFDFESVDLLESISVPLHKIASFELTDLPLIEYVAGTKKPMIMSTGMASVTEIEEAVLVAKKAGSKEIILLKCVSNYPARPEEMNLSTIPDMKNRFNCTIGLSDHTLGTGVSISSVTLGAKLVEKHFILSRKIKTPDSHFSIEPYELKYLVENIRDVEKSLGKVIYTRSNDEKNMLIYRRSLFAIEDIKKGELFSESNVRSIRPAYGLEPKYYKEILGKKATHNIKKGTPLKWKMVG